jgi:hypothetical protein
MSAKRNSYLFSRVAVWLSAGAIPSVTIACSSFRVNELSYRTTPTKDELISRRVSRVDNLQTIPIDRPMLERIRCAMAGLSSAVRRDADEYIKHDQAGSNWFFQPRQDGWFALFDGQPNDAHAFHDWLADILILKQGDSHF